MRARDVPAGEYAIVVSTSVPTNYVLTLAFADPTELQPVDVCNEGTLDVSLGGTFTGFFNDVFHDYALDCRTTTSSFPDAVYRLEIDSPKDVTLRARSLVGASRQTTYLSLVRDWHQAGYAGAFAWAYPGMGREELEQMKAFAGERPCETRYPVDAASR